MDFSERGAERFLRVPALFQQFVEILGAGGGLGEGGAGAGPEPGDQLIVGQVGVGPNPGVVQDLPHTHTKRPHVRLGRESFLKRYHLFLYKYFIKIKINLITKL